MRKLMDELLARTRLERIAQDTTWGPDRDLPAGTWSLVLQEEVGEVAEAVLEDAPPAQVIAELVQVAAVALAWAENYLRCPECGGAGTTETRVRNRYNRDYFDDVEVTCSACDGTGMAPE